ncbi:hypothetical protein TWF132_005058 [Orbilia oligospora]|nr:hypothetical protein TWF132_005058 [Orbilia oligospora]
MQVLPLKEGSLSMLFDASDQGTHRPRFHNHAFTLSPPPWPKNLGFKASVVSISGSSCHFCTRPSIHPSTHSRTSEPKVLVMRGKAIVKKQDDDELIRGELGGDVQPSLVKGHGDTPTQSTRLYS